MRISSHECFPTSGKSESWTSLQSDHGRRSVKLFAVYTREHAGLKDDWFLKTLKDPFELHLKDIGSLGSDRPFSAMSRGSRRCGSGTTITATPLSRTRARQSSSATWTSSSSADAFPRSKEPWKALISSFRARTGHSRVASIPDLSACGAIRRPCALQQGWRHGFRETSDCRSDGS